MFNQPWFSRKQLNIIILLTTLAIALLSLTGPKALPEAEIKEFDGTKLVFITDNTSHHYLRMSFPFPASQHASQFAPQLLFNVLQVQLKQSINPLPLRARLQHNRIQIDLITTELPSIQAVTDFLRTVAKPGSNGLWLSSAKELKARRYLEQQSSPSPLYQLSPLIGLDQRSEEDAVYLWQDFHQQVINRDNLTWTYLGPTPEPWLERITTGLNELTKTPGISTTLALWPPTKRLNTAPKGYQTLMLRQTKGKADSSFALELTSIQLINSLLPLDTLSDWVTAGDNGYWMLASRSNAAETLLHQLQSNIKRLSEQQFEAVQERLLEQLSSIPDNPETLLNQLESINLYGLPPDRLPQLHGQLEDISLQQIQERAMALLEVNDYYWLSVPEEQ